MLPTASHHGRPGHFRGGYQRLMNAAVTPAISLRVLTGFHLVVLGFLLSPGSTPLDTHWLWVAPFVVAAMATAAASVRPTEQMRIAAAVASIVAYASRALAFPLYLWLDAPVENPTLFPTVVWTGLIAYALIATIYSLRG